MHGIGVSPGIAIGKALVLRTKAITLSQTKTCEAETDIDRLHASLISVRTKLAVLKETAQQELPEQAQIIDVQITITKDPELLKTVEQQIRSGLTAEAAWQAGTDLFMELLSRLDDVYLAERVSDLRDIKEQVLYELMGIKQQNLAALSEDCILVAEDLAPSTIARMDKTHVIGFVTDLGGRTSHAAIMSRSLEIPAIVATRNITNHVNTGDLLIIDANKGQVIVRPSAADLAKYETEKADLAAVKVRLAHLRTLPTISADGHRVELGANIGNPEDCTAALRNGAEGIGLFRTEFLYLNREQLPTEEEQMDAYKLVLEKLAPKPVIIRTLDIGGDKALNYLHLPPESNPFLGYRAIRVCLKQQDVFRTQLRALLRASVFGNLKIMFPMISGMEELLQAKTILSEIRDELEQKGVPVRNDIEVGIMIEVPSAALISDLLAKEVDFFSIGTNDLVQYTLAVDRMNQEIAHLYSPFHPAVLRLIKLVIDNGHRAGIWVGMCGEAAGDPNLIPLLLGMGLDEFSMSAMAILPTRELIATTTIGKQAERVKDILQLTTAQEVQAKLTYTKL